MSGSAPVSGGDQRPSTVDAALLELADWLDMADRLIDAVFAAKGQERPNSGDDVQQDLRALAVWFTANPQAALSAWLHVQEVRS